MTKIDATTFENMIGKVVTSIDGGAVGSEDMTIETQDGWKFRFHYEADCCATCSVEDIAGDLDDLIGHPLVLAEEVTSGVDFPPADGYESFTWTYYRFGTVKGTVSIRWFGSSNGYYSESVTFTETKPPRGFKAQPVLPRGKGDPKAIDELDAELEKMELPN
jgi:hypothetical protein